MTRTIDNSQDILDSRDIIARIEELESDDTISDDEKEELATLQKLASEAESSPDWSYGETLIRDSYFVEYAQQLVDDCYTMPEGFNNGAWPWRHMTMDWEAAADELKADYFDVDFDGVTYWIRG